MHCNHLYRFFVVMLLLLFISACSSTPDKHAQMPSTSTSTAGTIDNPPTAEPDRNTSSLSQLFGSKPDTPDDVWQRLREGFSLSDNEQLKPETKKHLAWFLRRQDFVANAVERARPYLYHIVEEVDKRNMPLEVALLPVVESGFKPLAYSKSHAAGLWQFIPSTGKLYGLEQNGWYDGRRDVAKATSAALDYLQKLYNDFGDWQLALAAYNCGEGTVGRAIKRNQQAGKATDFWSLDLPEETSAYVPKLMAVSHMVKFAKRYDVHLSPIANKPYLTEVSVDSFIDLAKAAKMAGLSEEAFFHLNPAFNRGVTGPDGPYQLLVPLNKSKQFKTALANMPADARVQWAQHQVQRGDTLSRIASLYHTDVATIRQLNHLSSDQIQVGSQLTIPTSDDPIQLAASPAVAEPTQRQSYTVKAGDTWWNIAKRHQVDITDLARWNNKSSHDTLQVGQQLVVMTSTTAPSKAINYVIKNGDSLWAISRKFNVSVTQVREWNGLSDRSALQPGQQLKLYIDET